MVFCLFVLFCFVFKSTPFSKFYMRDDYVTLMILLQQWKRLSDLTKIRYCSEFSFAKNILAIYTK